MTCSKIYIARITAHVVYEGKRVLVRQGKTTVHEDHGLYKAHPELFVPQRVDWDVEDAPAPKPQPVVETATAEPEVPRRVGRPGRPPLPRDEKGNIIRPESPKKTEADDKEGEAS